ncbi:MAG: TIGR03118 family protein, partial [Acidobacteriaceae bacterium]|nr:TIGR03118 family protein [Acidobacteriaceae bacterium]
MRLRFGTVALLVACQAPLLFATSYTQTNLVSDIPGLAANTDLNLKDAWGMSFSATSPIWVSDRFTGLATLYNGLGVANSLVVTVPPGTPATGPTGQVFAGGTTFRLNGSPVNFI